MGPYDSRGASAGRSIVSTAPRPSTGGSRTRSPSIARHSSRDTYRPSPLPSPVGRSRAALEPAEQPVAVVLVDARAVVLDRDLDPRRRARRPATRASTPLRLPYFTALSRIAHRTWSSWSASASASQPSLVSSSVNGTSAAPSASHVAARGRAGDEDLLPRPQRAGLDPADGQQLADHPAEPVRLLGDDPEPPVRPLRLELLRVAADAGERRLEVVRDAAQEVVLRLVELDQPAVLVLDPRVQLGVADRRRDLDREQLQQVLSARSQRRVAGRCPTITPRTWPAATSSARTGMGSPGTTSSLGISRGSTSSSAQSIMPNARRASSAARAAMSSGRWSRVIDSSASRIRRSSTFRRWRSRARRLWLSASRLNSSSPGSSSGRPEVARGDPVDRARDGAQRRRRGRPRSRRRAGPRTRPRPRSPAAGRGTPSESALLPAPVTSSTTIPNPASGSTAAATSPSVRRVRNPSPTPR